MSSGRKPLSTSLMLGVLGSAGGILELLVFSILFALFSPGLSGENAPLVAQTQVVFLTILGISSVSGMIAAVLSIRYPMQNGAIMLAAAVTALIMIGSNPLFGGPLLLPIYGWWAVVLLLGGLFGILSRAPHHREHSGPSGPMAGSQSPSRIAER